MKKKEPILVFKFEDRFDIRKDKKTMCPPYKRIYIEAKNKYEAKNRFKKYFRLDPEVRNEFGGPEFFIIPYPSLEEATRSSMELLGEGETDTDRFLERDDMIFIPLDVTYHYDEDYPIYEDNVF